MEKDYPSYLDYPLKQNEPSLMPIQDSRIEPIRFHMFKADTTLSNEEYDAWYQNIESHIQKGVLILDNRFTYEGLK